MQNSQHQGAWDRRAAGLLAPGEGDVECPREEPNSSSGLGGGLSPVPGKSQCFRSADLNSALRVGSCCDARGRERVQQGKTTEELLLALPIWRQPQRHCTHSTCQAAPRDEHGPRLRQSNHPCVTLGR